MKVHAHLAAKRSNQDEPLAAARRGGLRAPAVVPRVLRTPGQSLDSAARGNLEARFGHDLGKIRIHADGLAAESARAVGALAYTVGHHVVFGAGQYSTRTTAGLGLLSHELAHAVQQGPLPDEALAAGHVPMHANEDHEQAADAVARRVVDGEPAQATAEAVEPGLMRTPVEKVLKFGVKWLSRRSAKFISKHIAKHTRWIAGKAVHSIFKSPRRIRKLLEQTLQEATALAAKHAQAPADRVIEEAGLRIARQSTGTPGKFRWVVQKEFKDAIGTAGERVLRVVLDQSGRIVTAFPADRLAVIGITAVGVEAFTESTANAAEKVRGAVEERARAEEERESRVSWWEFVPIIGDLWGGELNAGEDDDLRLMRAADEAVADVIRDVELAEMRSLNASERRELAELVRAAITTPILSEAGELADESE